MFGERDLLAPACGLAPLGRPAAPPVWHHLLFDRHEIVSANGVWVESLFLGGDVLAELPPVPALSALAALGRLTGHRDTVRPCLTRREALLMVREMTRAAPDFAPA